MAQNFGKINKPLAGSFKGKRKILLIPLLYGPPPEVEEGNSILDKYWDQVNAQITSLESSLGPINIVYVEYMTKHEQEAIEQVKFMHQGVQKIVELSKNNDSVIQATEDEAILSQFIDLQRLMMVPFTSEKIYSEIQIWYKKVVQQRYEYISDNIGNTLKDDQMGILIINENHQIQFPLDIEVIFISPPALDEFRKWLVSWINKNREPESEPTNSNPEANET